jgi:hypothetical protein
MLDALDRGSHHIGRVFGIGMRSGRPVRCQGTAKAARDGVRVARATPSRLDCLPHFPNLPQERGAYGPPKTPVGASRCRSGFHASAERASKPAGQARCLSPRLSSVPCGNLLEDEDQGGVEWKAAELLAVDGEPAGQGIVDFQPNDQLLLGERLL